MLLQIFAYRPYGFDEATCTAIQASVAASLNSLTSRLRAGMDSAFAPADCFTSVATVCGTFASRAEAAKLPASALSALVDRWVEVAAGGDLCRPEIADYTFLATTGTGSCLPLRENRTCVRERVPFAEESCNTTVGKTPFTISPRYVAYPPDPVKRTTRYCFTIEVVPRGINSAGCGPVDTLRKIAFYASEYSETGAGTVGVAFLG
ncbi:hypothetical protein PLESTM_001502200 [Pleodorina starrii]|nr:hypothetical protein PLESTM_001502200 [Pleodorina starrii]